MLSGEHGQHAGVAIQVVIGEFTACKEADQRHIAQSPSHQLKFCARPTKVSPTATGATDVHRAGNAPCRVGCGLQLRCQQRMGSLQRHLLRLQFFADLCTHTHQIRACRLHVALAKRHAGVLADLRRDRHTPACRIQANDVPHRHVVAKVAGLPYQFIPCIHQSDQRGSHRLNRLLGFIQRHLQIGQQHIERRNAIELQDQVAIGCGDGARGRHRHTVRRDTRHQPHTRAKRHAAHAATEHAAGSALATDVAVCCHGKLHAGKAAGRQTAKQEPRVGAVRQFVNQFHDIGGSAVGMHQRSVDLKTQPQRRHA